MSIKGFNMTFPNDYSFLLDFKAVLAVSIGVPVLLCYVYAVVPIALCRSDGCGVSAGQNGGVRYY